MSRIDELRALADRARIDLDNALFAVQMMPGDTRATLALDAAQERYSTRFVAWRKALHNTGIHAAFDLKELK